MGWTCAQKRSVSGSGLLGRDVQDLLALTLSLRDSSLIRRVGSARWRALVLGCKIISIPLGYPRPSGRGRRGVLHGHVGVGAELLNPFQEALASLSVGACMCCRNYSRH